MHQQPDGCARANGDRRLDLQIPRSELIAGARDALLGRLPHGLDQIALTAELQFRTNAEQGRQHHALEQRPGMEIDLRHAPTPLAACGLDMCDGHPAMRRARPWLLKRGSHASAPSCRRRERKDKPVQRFSNSALELERSAFPPAYRKGCRRLGPNHHLRCKRASQRLAR